jgi:hypothetical protein
LDQKEGGGGGGEASCISVAIVWLILSFSGPFVLRVLGQELFVVSSTNYYSNIIILSFFFFKKKNTNNNNNSSSSSSRCFLEQIDVVLDT